MIGKRSFVVAGLLSAALFVVAGTAMAAGHARHGPIQGKHRAGRDSVTSGNWSGYAAYGTIFRDVTGSWVVETASCGSVKKHQTTIASFWVGLDGYGSRTVEQTGTDSDCLGATPAYYAWYEFYPAGPVFDTNPTHTVSPGDHMTADVSVSDGTVITTLEDWGSSGNSLQWTYTSPAQSATNLAFSSAEWIVEKPSHLLTDFGGVPFSSATASDAAGTGPIDTGTLDWSYDAITLTNHPGPHGAALATPGGITDSNGAGSGTSSFSISQ